MGKIKTETIRSRVKKSLIEQLKAKGADIDIFTDQINDYMAMWDLKESLKADIEENGLRIMLLSIDSSCSLQCSIWFPLII